MALFRNFVRARECLCGKDVGPRCLMSHRYSYYTEKRNDEPEETHFGFERVKTHEKAEKVREVFETVSTKYDLMNDTMSLGIHRLWKDIFIQRLGPSPGTKLLDVAGGTGDIAFRFLKYLKNKECQEHNGTEPNVKGHATVCDINPAMLNVGKRRAESLEWIDNSDISWLEGDAEKLPVDSNLFSAYTIAFGIRNVTHINKALEEAYRILKPGGRFLCLEFSHVQNQSLRCESRAMDSVKIRKKT